MKTILYGFGNEGKVHVEKCLEKKIDIAYICDRNYMDLQEYKGIKIVSPDQLINEKENVLVVISTSLYYEQIADSLKRYKKIWLVSMDLHMAILSRCNNEFEIKLEIEKYNNYLFELDEFCDSKKIALFADNRILMPDTNAGNKSSRDYLNAIVDAGYKILFYANDMVFRERYIDELISEKVYVLWGRDRKKTIKQWLVSNTNLIVLNFINRPELVIDLEDYLKKTSCKTIYFGHDIHHVRLEREYQITKDESILEESNRIKNIEKDIIENSTVVGYPSMDEVEYIKSWIPDSNVKYFPLNVFRNHEIYSYRAMKRKGMMFVGGFNHKPNVDAVIWFCKEVLPQVFSNGVDDEFYIIGSNPTDEILKYESDKIHILGYVSDEELMRYYFKSRMVVIPLRYGAGMKGKLLEAMNYGTPVVTTNIGAEGLRNYKSCIVETSNANLANAIVETYCDDKLLEMLSIEAQRYIQLHFSEKKIHDVIDTYLDIEIN